FRMLLGTCLPQKPLEAGPAVRRDRAAGRRRTQGASLFVDRVRAVFVETRIGGEPQLDKAARQVGGGHIPERELADASGVGQPPTARERQESNAGRRVAPKSGRLADLPDPLLGAGSQ